MTCSNTHIRELLPAFSEGSLDAAEAAQVRDHLARCGDCAGELELLALMADNAVPDPGEAFWTSLPDRVYRQTARELAEKQTRRWWQGVWLHSLPARGAIALAMVVLVSWVLLRPARQHMPETTERSASVSLEELYEGPAEITDLESAELTRLDTWMEQEISVLRKDLARASINTNGFGRTLDEDLSAMDREELEEVLSALSSNKEV